MEQQGELGFVPGTLTHTVRVHNEYAAKGEDPLFHKTAKWLKPLDQPPLGYDFPHRSVDHCRIR